MWQQTPALEGRVLWGVMGEPELPDPSTIPSKRLVWIAGGTIDRVNVVLRLFGDDLEAEQVTEQVGIPPTTSQRKGDVLPKKRYRHVAETGSWRLACPKDATGALEDKISYVLHCVSDDPAISTDLKQFRHDVFRD